MGRARNIASSLTASTWSLCDLPAVVRGTTRIATSCGASIVVVIIVLIDFSSSYLNLGVFVVGVSPSGVLLEDRKCYSVGLPLGVCEDPGS